MSLWKESLEGQWVCVSNVNKGEGQSHTSTEAQPDQWDIPYTIPKLEALGLQFSWDKCETPKGAIWSTNCFDINVLITSFPWLFLVSVHFQRDRCKTFLTVQKLSRLYRAERGTSTSTSKFLLLCTYYSEHVQQRAWLKLEMNDDLAFYSKMWYVPN